MQAQVPLRVIICYLTVDISLGIEWPTLDKWLEMGTLRDWTAYNDLNTDKTLTDKAKTFCL
jgi:hypothetical protein